MSFGMKRFRVKFLFYFSRNLATWHRVRKGKDGQFGPQLGVHYGWVDEFGYPVPPTNGGKTGGIKGVKKPQLAIHSVWSAKVAASLEEAKRSSQ